MIRRVAAGLMIAGAFAAPAGLAILTLATMDSRIQIAAVAGAWLFTAADDAVRQRNRRRRHG